MEFEVSVDRTDSENISVRIKGDVNVHTSPELKQVMAGFLSGPVKSVQILLDDVPRMDSSGIATLVEGLQWSRQTGKRFVISGLTEAVRDLFVLSKLEQEFDIVESGQKT